VRGRCESIGRQHASPSPARPGPRSRQERLIRIDDLVSIVEEIAGVRLHRRYNLDAPKGVRGGIAAGT
jgi:hypothetical protein